jgi:hypothetical protein
LGDELFLYISLRTLILKKLHLDPQNGPGSENLLKIVNCQNGQKTILSHLEKVGGPDIHLDQVLSQKYEQLLK